MQPINPFANNQLRCLYDKGAKKWWFSAVDICAMLTGSDYETARRHWKRLKCERELSKNQSVRKSNQLKMPGSDGKYYYTDVLDIKEVIYLMQTIPGQNAEPYKLWLAETVANSTNIETLLADAGAESAKQIEEFKKNSQDSYALHNIVRKNILPN